MPAVAVPLLVLACCEVRCGRRCSGACAAEGAQASVKPRRGARRSAPLQLRLSHLRLEGLL